MHIGLTNESCYNEETVCLLNEEICLLDEVNTIDNACRANRHAVATFLELRDAGTCTVMHAFHMAI